MILYKPIIPMHKSQTITIGANKKATLCVPRCCKAKRPMSTMHATITTSPVCHIENLVKIKVQKKTNAKYRILIYRDVIVNRNET